MGRGRKREEKVESIVCQASGWPGIRSRDSVAYRLPLRVVVKQVTYLLLEGNSAPRSIFQIGIPLHKSMMFSSKQIAKDDICTSEILDSFLVFRLSVEKWNKSTSKNKDFSNSSLTI